MKKKVLNVNERIRRAMKINERNLLAHIRDYAKQGITWTPEFNTPMRWWHAKERLEKSGKIKFNKRKGGYVIVK